MCALGLMQHNGDVIRNDHGTFISTKEHNLHIGGIDQGMGLNREEGQHKELDSIDEQISLCTEYFKGILQDIYGSVPIRDCTQKELILDRLRLSKESVVA